MSTVDIYFLLSSVYFLLSTVYFLLSTVYCLLSMLYGVCPLSVILFCNHGQKCSGVKVDYLLILRRAGSHLHIFISRYY